MAWSVWEVFLALFGGGEDPESDSGEADDDGRFVPSPLDLSVRMAHGGSDDQRVRALGELNERADELEEGRRGP
ncbi:hypothetical protein [Halobacterium yunchengense]|uniref:hypothetical protein n=1 Tax=Halobacterium yunchengense TaxID=3108497 RepID=UPI00300A9FDC